MVTLYAAAPMLLSGMIVGLGIRILPVLQVQEMTLTFFPRITQWFIIILSFSSVHLYSTGNNKEIHLIFFGNLIVISDTPRICSTIV